MKPYLFFGLILFSISLCVIDARAEGKFTFSKQGVIQVEQLEIGVTVRDLSWNSKEQKRASESNLHEQSATEQRFTCKLSSDFQLNQQVSELTSRHCRIKYDLNADSPVAVNSIYLGLPLFIGLAEGNEMRIDEKRIVFPKQLNNSFPQNHKDVIFVELPLNDGFLQCRFDQPVAIRLEDLRTWNIQAFDVRFSFTPGNGKVKSASLDVDMSYVPYQVKPLSIHVNGPAQSARKLQFRYMSFLCSKPVKSQTSIEIPEESRTLYLLHAADAPAGETVAELKMLNRDGNFEVIPIIAGKQIGSINASSMPNEAIEIDEQPDGHYYVTALQLPGRVQTVHILPTSDKYQLLSAAYSEQSIPLRSSNGDFTLTDGKNWRRMNDKLDVIAGSAMDFSSFAVDAPAGKYGRVVVRNGHFQFERRPDIPVRFYGANLCFTSSFPTKEEAKIITQRLVRQGFNAVRLHHFDHLLVKNLPNDSCTIDPAQLDKMDYLVATLKNAGVYITLDLFTIRSNMPGEVAAFPEGLRKYDGLNYKIAMLLYPEVRATFKKFIQSLLTHKNPYTGLAWKDDPVINHISVINENNPRQLFDRTIPAIKKELRRQTEEYSSANGIALNDSNRRDLEIQMLMRRYNEYWQDITGFLRDIGVQTPLTEQNFYNIPYLLEQRRNYDYVDNHLYWDHPNFGGNQWALPMFFISESVLKYRARVPKELAGTRVLGKPFTITELSFCYPNSYRAECSLLYCAFAALQDWDGMYHYDYADGLSRMFPQDHNHQLRIFDICNDMARLVPAKFGTALFLRGDVAAAHTAYPIAVDVTSQHASAYEFPVSAQELSFRGRVGSLFVQNGQLVDPLPEGTQELYNMDNVLKSAPVPFASTDDTNLPNQIQSDTGELTFDFTRHTFNVVTAKTEGAIFPAGDGFTGNILTARSRKGFGVIGAIALNGESLVDSSRILILHVTDCKQENSVYDSSKQTILKVYGDFKHVLAEHGICDLTLALPEKNWQIYALDFDGTRLGKVDFKYQDSKICFTADTFYGEKDVVFAYELVNE